MLEGYLAEDAGFVLPLVRPGSRIVDVGCRHGAGTLAIATAAHPVHVLGVDSDPDAAAKARLAARRGAVSSVDFLSASPDRLPLPESAVDLVFSHSLLGTVPNPLSVLAEFARVLRPGGTLAVATVDWSKAKLRPRTANVEAALRGLHLLRRRSGIDPFAGRRAAEWVERAGFREVRSRARYRQGIGYRELAAQVEAELAAAVSTPDRAHDPQLASAARSAWMWVRGGGGDFAQCWVEITATRS